MNTSTETLVSAMRALSNDIQSEDGVANAAIAEAADRLEQLSEKIKRLEELGNDLRECASQMGYVSAHEIKWLRRAGIAVKAWDKEAKL